VYFQLISLLFSIFWPTNSYEEPLFFSGPSALCIPKAFESKSTLFLEIRFSFSDKGVKLKTYVHSLCLGAFVATWAVTEN